MLGFVEFSEEKKITVKTKMGGEIPATIKVTGKDYHIVKTDSGKQYKVDHQGNSLEEEIELSEEQLDELKKSTLASYAKKSAVQLPGHQTNATLKATGPLDQAHGGKHPKTGESPIQWDRRKVKNRQQGIIRAVDKLAKEETDKDLPFTPDKPHKPVAKAGKYGSAYSTVRHLARQAMKKQAEKLKKEDVDLEEASKGYAPGWMLKADPELAKKVKARIQSYKDLKKYAGKELTKNEEGCKISVGEEMEPHYKRFDADAEQERRDREEAETKAEREKTELAKRSKMKEELELQEASDSHKVLVTVSDPHHQAVSQRKEQIMKHVIVRAGDKGEAQAKAEAFYKKKGYKVHGSEYHSKQPATSMKTEETSIDEAVSSDSKAHYEYASGKKPSGKGNWMFSTVHPTKHDTEKHKDQTYSASGNYSDVAKAAAKHFKDKGHSGEIHVLS